MCLSNRPKVSYKVSSNKIMGKKRELTPKKHKKKQGNFFFTETIIMQNFNHANIFRLGKKYTCLY